MDESWVFANLMQILVPGAPKIDCCGKGSHGEGLFARFFNARLAAELKRLKKTKCVFYCVLQMAYNAQRE